MPMPVLTKEQAAEFMSGGNTGGGGATQLPEGIYCMAIADYEERFSKKGTQGMLAMRMQPCTKPGQKKTAVADKELTTYLMLPYRNDEETFRASVAASLAKKNGCEPDAISDAELLSAVAEREKRDARSLKFAMYAIFGRDHFPPTPFKDKATGEYKDDKGRIYDRSQVSEMWDEHNAAVYDVATKVVNGDLDVRGYIVYARVVDDEFNGKATSKIVTFWETCPPDESLVDSGSWA
jgi:hypothetical protein